jgi:hypothetical protein
MQVQIEKRYYTPEEYCQLEETAEYKNEYRDGEIIPNRRGLALPNPYLTAKISNFCDKFIYI